MNGPLSSVRVVVLAGMGPTAFASMLLADYGADVVRITRPSTQAHAAATPDGEAEARFDLANRGIRSVQLDLKDPGGVAALLGLVRAAEVFIEGYRPGVVERLGLGPDDLKQINPSLVYARLTGYGQDGLMARAAGHDINYIAQSGVLSLLKQPGQPPAPPINLLGDYAGGGALAALGIASAVLHARYSGIGQVVDSAMVDGVAVIASKILGLRSGGLFPGEPGTNYLDGGAPFYGCYECLDGAWLAVGAIEPGFYSIFLEGLGIDTSEWPAQNNRAQWPQLRRLIAEVVATRTRDDWAQSYANTDACVTAVLSPEEAVTDSHNAQRGMFYRVDDVQHPFPSPRFSETPARIPSAPTDELTELSRVEMDWARQR